MAALETRLARISINPSSDCRPQRQDRCRDKRSLRNKLATEGYSVVRRAVVHLAESDQMETDRERAERHERERIEEAERYERERKEAHERHERERKEDQERQERGEPDDPAQA